MSEAISEKLQSLLQRLEQSGQTIEPEDVDEIKILHSYCRDEFPDSFNNVIESYSYRDDNREKIRFIRRLLRIFEVERSIPSEIKIKAAKSHHRETDLKPTFEIKQEDKDRIFDLCCKMRNIILATIEFDEPHRRRLLNRIAAIEAETQKPLGMFDVVLGGVSDIGETLGKFGKDIKPLTDRMAEVARIARKGTKEYDQIPAPEEIEKLPKPEDFKDQ